MNVAGLYGFWRPGPPLVKSHLSGWPFLLLGHAAGHSLGPVRDAGAWRARGRALALSCVRLAIVGGLLAMGTQGPTGGIYTWLFDHLPGFKVMREAGKFSALLALGYATCFGLGRGGGRAAADRGRCRGSCVFAVSPPSRSCTATPSSGFDGYARPTVYPVSWAAADRSMSPEATAIALPWRAYLRVPWAGDQRHRQSTGELLCSAGDLRRRPRGRADRDRDKQPQVAIPAVLPERGQSAHRGSAVSSPPSASVT